MLVHLAVFIGKVVSLTSRFLGLGAGETWSGEIALRLYPRVLPELISNLGKGVIIIAGTNGKTTTALMIKQILKREGYSVVHNGSGANLDNGIVAVLIQNPTADWGVFEVDENSLPHVISMCRSIVESEKGSKQLILVLLNLFRDQLDRYGKVDVISKKWEKALTHLSQSTLPHTLNPTKSTGSIPPMPDLHLSAQAANQATKADQKNVKNKPVVIVNADDPLAAHLGLHLSLPVMYFGVTDKTKFLSHMEHATDSTFCLNCGARLVYEGIYFSHIGIWRCPSCGESRPKPHITHAQSSLPGLYNLYNSLAAVSVAKHLNVKDAENSVSQFRAAFGRQEEIIVGGPTSSDGLRGASKKVKLFLSKNPAGFNQSLRTILELGAAHIVFVLNDRIPDGRDVSWIWDVDFETVASKDTNKNYQSTQIYASGDRVYDLAIRLKYAGISKDKLHMHENLEESLKESIENLGKGETLYILPTYSAMLDVRKIITGRKIL